MQERAEAFCRVNWWSSEAKDVIAKKWTETRKKAIDRSHALVLIGRNIDAVIVRCIFCLDCQAHNLT